MTVEISLWKKRAYFFVNGDLPPPVTDQLSDLLSYEVPDAQWTDAWRNNEWDGRRRLFRQSQNGNWMFPIGLLGHVRKVLDARGIDYEVKGLSRPGRGDMGYEWNFPHDLRGYQSDIVDECLSAGSGVVVMPTGTGKTVIGIRVIYELDQPAIIVLPMTEIADQWVERLEDTLGVEVARYYGGDREQGDVMVALYQSLYDDETGEVRDDVRLDHPVAVFDETHRVAADTFSDVALAIRSSYRYGLTATPEREDNATLRVVGGTGPIIGNLSVEKMIDEGWLAEPEFEFYEAPASGGGYENWQQEYAAEIVENEGRNESIASIVADLEKPCLVTVERINHGERLEAKIDGSRFAHGSANDRAEIIQAFRDGDLDVMIATRGIVGEGFDVPEIASFVVGGGLRSSTSMIQQVGRALRPETDKATIVDFSDRGYWVSQHTEDRIRTYQDYYGSYGP